MHAYFMYVTFQVPKQQISLAVFQCRIQHCLCSSPFYDLLVLPVADLCYGAQGVAPPRVVVQKYFFVPFQTAIIICLHSEAEVTH